MDYRSDSPQLLLDFLSYHETIKAHSQRTVDEYYLDMRNFFRYLKQVRDPALADKRLDEIDIRDIDLNFIAAITRQSKCKHPKRTAYAVRFFCAVGRNVS